MASKITIACLVLACATIALAQRYQTLPYNPSVPLRPQTLPYNPNNRPAFHTLPYRPTGGRNQIYRVRRDILSGSLSSNPNGGADAKVQAGYGIGTPDHNLAAGVFAAGNTDKGPVTSGGTVGYNVNGHGLSATQLHTPGVADVFTQNVKANLFNNDNHNLDANLFKSQTTLANGFDFTKTGGNLDYSNINGHGAKFGVSSIPNLGTTYELGAKANLWQSQDKMTAVDLFGSASKTHGGFFDGQRNLGGGISLTSFFG